MATEALVESMVLELAEIYGNRSNDLSLQISIWTKALSGVDDNTLSSTYQTLVKTNQKSYMPKPADFYEAMWHGVSEDATLSWNQLFKAIKSNAGRPLEFEDTVLAETVRQLGGVDFLSGLAEKDFGWQRKPFIETYCILAKRGKEYDPVCPAKHVARPVAIQTISERRKPV